MIAITREKHQRVCKMLEDFKFMNTAPDNELSALTSELNEIFIVYQRSLEDVRTCIYEYNVKQKAIRQRMKQILRNELEGKRI